MTIEKSIWCPKCTAKFINFISFKSASGQWILTSEVCSKRGCGYKFPIIKGDTEDDVFKKGEALRKKENRRFVNGKERIETQM